jgi:peptide-methionine (S)-S-oxide reductase
VVATRVGYTGGQSAKPTYGSVCGNDGHTEALRLWFDPSLVSFDQLLATFFAEHNPTRRSHKAQYKSAVWWHSPEQERAVKAAVAALEEAHGVSVATTLAPAGPWTDAEEHHQKYMEKAGWKRQQLRQ